MQADFTRRRALVAAGPCAAQLADYFHHETLKGWETVEAGSFSQARFVIQHSPCDVALVNDDLLQHEGEQALVWLARHGEVPVVFLTGDTASTMARAYSLGVSMCLARSALDGCPQLLASALERAAQLADAGRAQRRTQEQFANCRRHVDRLVNLLWRASPLEPNTHWFTQRFTLERLQEEISRTERHGAPLTLAVAQVETEEQEQQPATDGLDEWTSSVITQAKRRCDVAGQYGMQGFLLLMVHTPKTGGIICCRRLKRLLEIAATDTGTGPRGPIRAYFGLASSAAETATAQGLLRSAEQNLEAARAGKDDGVVAE